ncbi:hypothetical protein D7X33_01490 [Butyricicoccus sp. 1XD8-22]|nr:hypothetical protein D7X33_01490 [Butyricicoccus sp. 1XD8-22]
MESAGTYWFLIHNILEESCHVVVSHPKFVKAIKGKKTDKKDAQWVAGLFTHLCSWAGLTPQNAESAGKKKTTRIGKAAAYLKPLPIQVALTCQPQREAS